MFRGLQPIRSRISSVKIVFDTGASHSSQVSNFQFLRTNAAMAAVNGVDGATAKTLKMENARGLL